MKKIQMKRLKKLSKKSMKKIMVITGYRRIDLELCKRGYIVNHKKILRITKKLKIICTKFTRKSSKFSTHKGTVGKVAKNLINRGFHTSIPSQKITTDTTEFKYYMTDSRSEEHTSELQSRGHLVCRLLLEK